MNDLANRYSCKDLVNGTSLLLYLNLLQLAALTSQLYSYPQDSYSQHMWLNIEAVCIGHIFLGQDRHFCLARHFILQEQLSSKTEYPRKMYPADTSKPWPIMLNFLPIIHYALSNAQKICLLCSILYPSLLQLCHNLYMILLFLMTRLAELGSR